MSESQEAKKRKKRSESILEDYHIPILDELPVIETNSQSHRRTPQEVAERILALAKVYLTSQKVEHGFLGDGISKCDLRFLSPLEEIFVKSSRKSRREIDKYSWRIECLWVMLWVVNRVPKMSAMDQECDVHTAIDLVKSWPVERLLDNSKMRSQAEILDECDLIYRCHWAVRDAQLSGEMLPVLNAGVIMERHYALNWLTQ